ncbi:MAG: EI24 domain-containing protein [Bdellovibrionota bacterium]
MIQHRIRSLIFGMTLPTEALRMIFRHPKLLFWAALPTTLTLALYFWGIARLQEAARAQILTVFASHGWDTSSGAALAAFWGIRILLWIGGAITFSIAASLIATPFNDLLAEQAERYVPWPLPRPSGQGFRFKTRLMIIDAMKSTAALTMEIIALLLSWVPALNVAALLAAVLLVCFQYLSYPQTRRGLGIGEGLNFLGRHFFACIGFGAVMTALFAIPVVSSLCVPLAVVGGTLLASRAQKGAGPFPLR